MSPGSNMTSAQRLAIIVLAYVPAMEIGGMIDEMMKSDNDTVEGKFVRDVAREMRREIDDGSEEEV